MNLEIATKFFEKYEADTTVQNFIAQANSRFILYNANEPIENFPKYTVELDEKCLHIAFSYLNFGWCFFDKKQKNKAIYCIEKAAEILEHLYAYNKCEKTYKEFYNLTCAVAYYVSSQYSKSFIVLKYYTYDTQLAKILKLLLVRNFIDLEEELKNIEFTENFVAEEAESFIYTKILATAIAHMLQYIINGNNVALMEARKILLDLINLSQINNESHLWWIFRLLYLVFEEYEEASLWTVLPLIISNEEKCFDYIRANIYKQPPIVELFRSQRECIYRSLNSDESVVIGMPTSSGKTKIAEISIIKTLIADADALCVYIAPFRSLANEIEHSLSGVLNSMGYVLSHLYGSAQATQMDRQLVTEANVVVATPEKMKSILRSNPDLEERIKLVIVDEGHLVGAQPRYITAELLVEEIKITLKKNSGKFILLSAVLPNLSDFAEWISGSQERISTSVWRPSAQRFGELSFVNYTVNLQWEGDPPSCMTATEAALYDRMTSGDLKSKLGNITHQNLPLAMFLEKPDLGFPAWKGSTSGIRSNEDIISSLGIGTVRFTEQPEEPKDEDDTPPAGTKVYEYHTNTDVITAIDVKDTKGGKSGISPDDKAKVTFRVNGNTYTKSFVTPPHESTPLWIKWRTPSTPQKVTINVSSTHGQVITPTVIANVTELTESTPPDPESRDTNKGFRVPKVPKQMNVTRLTWGEWLPKWHENWEWESDWQWKKKGHNSNCKPDCTKNHGGKWVDKGKYVDNGWWVYTWREYYATASAESTVKPADQVPTAYKSGNTYKMKSGYGINIDVKAKVFTTGKNGDITTAQNAIATFPEFGYSTYNRVLELTGRNEFAFRRNPYSMYKAPVHFLPVWYPDRSDYAPQTVVLDIWTPSGQLMVYSDDKLRIDGSYFDDWHVAPQLVR